MEVVAAVLIQKSRVLLAQRPLSKNHGGLWEFPGGKIDSGESPTEALSRELFEELRVRISETELKPLASIKNETITIHFYPVKLTGAYAPQEHRAMAWMEIGKIKNLPLCPSDQRFVEDFAQALTEEIEKMAKD